MFGETVVYIYRHTVALCPTVNLGVTNEITNRVLHKRYYIKRQSVGIFALDRIS